MGRPKAWLPVGDELMLQRVVRVLRTVLSPVVVVAAPGQDVPDLPADVIVTRDEVEGKGPLGGLSAGLAATADRADAVYLSACDVPFLKAEFVARMATFLTDDVDIVVPDVGGYQHPLAPGGSRCRVAGIQQRFYFHGQHLGGQSVWHYGGQHVSC